jgi:hypothetical protein
MFHNVVHQLCSAGVCVILERRRKLVVLHEQQKSFRSRCRGQSVFVERPVETEGRRRFGSKLLTGHHDQHIIARHCAATSEVRALKMML